MKSKRFELEAAALAMPVADAAPESAAARPMGFRPALTNWWITQFEDAAPVCSASAIIIPSAARPDDRDRLVRLARAAPRFH